MEKKIEQLELIPEGTEPVLVLENQSMFFEYNPIEPSIITGLEVVSDSEAPED